MSKTLDLVELVDHDECCGFGGLFSVKMPDLSSAMLKKKIEHINACPADTIVVGDVSCLTHMNGGLSRQKSNQTRPTYCRCAGGGSAMKNTANQFPTAVRAALQNTRAERRGRVCDQQRRRQTPACHGRLRARSRRGAAPAGRRSPAALAAQAARTAGTGRSQHAGQRDRGAVGAGRRRKRAIMCCASRASTTSSTSPRARAWSARKSS